MLFGNLFFNSTVDIPATLTGKPIDPDEIGDSLGLEQGDSNFIMKDPGENSVEGWTLHVIPPGEKWGDQVHVTEDMLVADLTSQLLELPEGSVVTTTLILPGHQIGYGFRRTRDGFNKIYEVVIDHKEGFSLEVF